MRDVCAMIRLFAEKKRETCAYLEGGSTPRAARRLTLPSRICAVYEPTPCPSSARPRVANDIALLDGSPDVCVALCVSDHPLPVT